MQVSFCSQYFPSCAQVKLKVLNTEMITNIFSSEMPTNVQQFGRLKVKNKVLLLALINLKGPFKDTYS